jgi:tRNA(fMet)-specific endonuclease VapC
VYLLDTDVVSNALDVSRDHEQLRARVRANWNDVYISVITLDEMIIEGVLPPINEARQQRTGLPEAYRYFEELWNKLHAFKILSYDEAADAVFRRFPNCNNLPHPNDARIAAIAISRGYTVITHNQRHFRNLEVELEDWEVLDPDDIPPPDWYTEGDHNPYE